MDLRRKCLSRHRAGLGLPTGHQVVLGGPGLGHDLALLESHWGLVAVDFFFNLLEYQKYERNTCTHDPGVAAQFTKANQCHQQWGPSFPGQGCERTASVLGLKLLLLLNELVVIHSDHLPGSAPPSLLDLQLGPVTHWKNLAVFLFAMFPRVVFLPYALFLGCHASPPGRMPGMGGGSCFTHCQGC